MGRSATCQRRCQIASVTLLILLPSAPTLVHASDDVESSHADRVDARIAEHLATNDRIHVLVRLSESSKEEIRTELSFSEKRQIYKRNADRFLGAQRRIIELLDPAEFQLRHQFKSVSAFSGVATARAVAQLSAIPSVAAIDADRIGQPTLEESREIIGADVAENAYGYTGEGVGVCVIDSGVDYTQGALGGCSDDEFESGNCAKVPDGYDFCNTYFTGILGCAGEDDNPRPAVSDHGTHVAGIIASEGGTYRGIAPDSHIIALKVCQDEAGARCSMIEMGRAVDWCIDHAEEYNIKVINMSLGIGLPSSEPACRPFGLGTEADILSNARDLGFFVVSSSGNAGSLSGIKFPGCADGVTSVGATYDFEANFSQHYDEADCQDENFGIDDICCFTNRGTNLDLLAPGARIKAPATSTSSNAVATLSGTSQAAPHVAGAAAVLLEMDPSLQPAEIESLLKDTGVAVESWKRIDLAAAIEELCDCGQWSDGTCGGGNCGSNERRQSRVCSPTDCGSSERCVPDAQCTESMTLDVSPSILSVDSSSCFTLLASVFDGNDQPLEGAFVSFEQDSDNAGYWVNCGSCTPRIGPNNGPTNSQGMRVSCFKPEEAAEYCFSATAAGRQADDCASVTGIPCVDIATTVGRSAGCTYTIEARFLNPNTGEPLQHGQAFVRVPCGQFDQNSGPSTQTACEELSFASGSVSLDFSIPGTCNGEIEVCYIEVAEATCADSNDCNCQRFPIDLCCDPASCPVQEISPNPEHALLSPYGSTLPLLDAGESGNFLAALNHGNGLLIWDTHDWTSTKIEPSLFDWSTLDQNSGSCIAYADGSAADRIAVVGTTGSGNQEFSVVLDRSQNSAVAENSIDSCSWKSVPEGECDFRADGQALAVVMDCFSNCGCSGERVEQLSANGQFSSVVENLPVCADDEAKVSAVAISPDGSRIAYTYRDRCESPSSSYFGLNTSTGSQVIAPFLMQVGVTPGALDFSPDGEFIVADGGEGALFVFTREGSVVRTILTENNVATSLKFSPNGQYIGVHYVGGGALILDFQSGQQLARLLFSNDNNEAKNTLAWRYDSQVVFLTSRTSDRIYMFAPLDAVDPIVGITSPSANELVFGDVAQVVGTVNDDVGLPPKSLEWSLDGGQWTATDHQTDGSFAFSVNLTYGDHTVCIKANDIAGNEEIVCRAFSRALPPNLVLEKGVTTIESGDLVDLGAGVVGQESCKDITIRNSGEETLIVDCPSTGSDFLVSGCPLGGIASGQATSFGLCANTSDCGVVGTQVTIVSNDPDHQPDPVVFDAYMTLGCDDNIYCNGQESCDESSGMCMPGMAIACDDGVECTLDICDETAKACAYASQDSFCDNGSWCDGTEVCDSLLGCQSTSGPCQDLAHCDEAQDVCICISDEDCDDEVACTVDTCDNEGACLFTPQDDLCDNGLYCDGIETCDGLLGCVAGTSIDCSDGLACTTDQCDEDLDTCAYEIISGFCLIESACVLGGATNPANPCFSCQPVADALDWAPQVDGTACDDGDSCTNSDQCLAGTCTGTSIPNCPPCVPNCSGRNCGSDGCGGTCGSCTGGASCNTSTGQCESCVPNCSDRACGTDGCGGSCGSCGPGEICDTSLGECVTDCTPDCTGRECGSDGCEGSCGTCPDDELFCTTAPVCANGLCQVIEDRCAGATPVCCEDLNICVAECCSSDDCDDSLVCQSGTCVSSQPVEPCDDGIFCNGKEAFEDGTCTDGAPPCSEGEICNEQRNECQPDTDEDGVSDDDDECPDTPLGGGVNFQNGCRYFVVTIMIDGESIPGQPTREGEIMIGAPTPPLGHFFSHWEGADVPVGQAEANPLMLVLDSNKNLTAVFILDGGSGDTSQTACGACGEGATSGMLLLVVGWAFCRVASPDRKRI